GAEVGDLDLGGPLDHVAHRIAGVAGRHDEQVHAGDHHHQGQPDHQPHHGLAPEGTVFLFVCHCMGPKKLLSTVSLAPPSTVSTRKSSGWRPVRESGAVTITGTLMTCCASACTRSRLLPRSSMPGAVASMVMRYVASSSLL